MGEVEPWLMACWKARVEFLLSVIELLFLSLTAEALQGKTCQNSLLSGGGRSLGAKISGGRGHSWGISFGFYKTRHILLSDSANCTMLRHKVPKFVVFWTILTIKGEKSAAKFHYTKTVSGKVVV